MRFRKKSSTSTSSSSSSTSSSSSCSSDSSSDTEESSSSAEDKVVGNAKNADAKSQVTTRRKSSECKAAAKAAENEKCPTGASAGTTTGAVSSTKSRPNNNPIATNQRQRRKTSASSASGIAAPGGGKAPPSGIKHQNSTQQQHHVNAKTATTTKQSNASKQISGSTASAAAAIGASSGGKNAPEKELNISSPALTDDSDVDMPTCSNKTERKPLQTKQISAAATTSNNSVKRNVGARSKTQPRRNTNTRGGTRVKSSGASESESGSRSVSGDGSSSSSESEASDSSNSFTLHEPATKAVRGKRAPNAKLARTDSDDAELQETAPRKLTRSLSTRRTKQQLKHSGATGAGTDSDSDGIAEIDAEKRSLSKSPAKKYNSVTSKSKVKKEGNALDVHPKAPRSISPPQQVEKKCPIEGCDSSGHLCGNLDRHFLPEACPIYHNMSASECKERANERKVRDEQRLKANNSIANNANAHNADIPTSVKMLTAEQKDFLAKIRESRARYRPPITAAINTDKVKLEKDCTDEDREPSLSGLVPDYDLQLFREAQAIASEKIEDELKDLPVGKGIKYITMGKYKMKVWYQSPYPDDAARLPKMYICEFCLRYQKSETGIKRHAQKCVWRHPPGDEIYRKGKLQVWQVDGKRHKQYCQHLCLLAKFFLDHKTLYYDVEPFLFYIMTLADVDGCHTVGYFSKEKNSFYNVSCILTLPPYQRKGYGRLLIDFSYLLTRVEGKIGSPEKPLSDLGLISYRSYWKDVLLDYLCNRSGNTLSIKDVSQEMAIYSYDIVSTLQALGMMKYWKGKHIVLKKQDVLDEYEERVKRRGNFPKIDGTCLRWRPFVPTQTNNAP